MDQVAPVGGLAAWRAHQGVLAAQTVDVADLPVAARDELDALHEATASPDATLAGTRRWGAELTRALAGGAFMGVLAGQVLGGRGLLVLRGLPFDPGDQRRCELALVAMLAAAGEVLDQNVAGDPVYTVIDRADPRGFYGGSRATGRLRPHTDQAAAPEAALPHLLVQWCLHPARTGGEALVTSGHALHDQLVAESPELAGALYEPLPFARDADGVSDAPPVRSPVFRHVGGALRVRYNAFFTEGGVARTGRALTPAQHDALAAAEALAESGALRETLPLGAGDLLFIDNRAVLHDRTAYEDWPDVGRKRRLLRGWARITERPWTSSSSRTPPDRASGR